MTRTLLWMLLFAALPGLVRGEWIRHTIDDTSRGADGVRVTDIDADGRPDLVTGWEEGGVIRVYTHPGVGAVNSPWPRIEVGRVHSPEDALFTDWNGDGIWDVVSCCEGKTRSVFFHRRRSTPATAPESGPIDFEWQTLKVPALAGQAMWMYAAPLDIDRQFAVDLVIGAKGSGATIGWLQAPSDANRIEDWQWHPLTGVGWVMSIIPTDMDDDGDFDLLYSDRKGDRRGVHWLEYDSARDLTQPWPRHTVGGIDREVMFLSLGDVNQDGRLDIACAVKDDDLIWFERLGKTGTDWAPHSIALPSMTGTGKGVAIADVDLDGRRDLLFTCEGARELHGVGWLSAPVDPTEVNWQFHEISGLSPGIKFDLIQTLDLDDDGDLDLITCEERDNLGVIWYENPARSK